MYMAMLTMQVSFSVDISSYKVSNLTVFTKYDGKYLTLKSVYKGHLQHGIPLTKKPHNKDKYVVLYQGYSISLFPT